jgi:Protein of unknown function (DUF3826)
MKIGLFSFFVSVFFSATVFAQDANNMSDKNDKEAVYIRTITSRAEKIVNTLGISDALKAKQVTTIIADQYKNLNKVYTERDEEIKSIRQKGLSKEETDSELKKFEASADKKVEVLHTNFLSVLSSELTPEQVTKVKDGMTYNVLNVTYTAFLDMIPALTTDQKSQIMAWLIEAREHAMDAESSEKKHWWFGKYKGRINNYLSAQGYDLNKERKEWEERQKTKGTSSK